jgi:flagellar basal-body rod modification protein FlgD
MQAQDPLQPIESTEFVAQLAQFSSVEQQVQTNKRLGEMLEALSSGNASALGAWLGREVRAPAPAAFSGAPVTAFTPEPPPDTASARLVVRGPADEVVAEIPFEPGERSVTWDGKTLAGGTAAPGLYRFEARFATGRGDTEVYPAEVFGRVVEARRENGAAVLHLAGGGTVDADAVSAVRLPPAAAPDPAPDPAVTGPVA